MYGLNSIMNSFFKKRLIPFYLIFIIAACTQIDNEDVMEEETSLPTRILTNADVIFKDSGFIKINLHSPLIEEYERVDTPYTLFPKGVEMNYYTASIDSPGFLRADWAMMSDMKGWYEGRGNIVVINEKGDTLKTQKLFWNKKERRIFTRDTVYIITLTGDSLQANNGLEANENLTEYQLFNNRGTKIYKENL